MYTVHQCPTSQHGSIFDPLLGVSWWSAMPAQHLCGRPVAFELSTRQLERSASWQGQLQTSAEDAFIYTEAFSVLEMFQDNTLYKFT